MVDEMKYTCSGMDLFNKVTTKSSLTVLTINIKRHKDIKKKKSQCYIYYINIVSVVHSHAVCCSCIIPVTDFAKCVVWHLYCNV